MAAGCQGLFAVEQDAFAFDTLKHNLIDSDSHCPYKYQWPSWLDAKPAEISRFIKLYEQNLKSISGQLDLVVGGPPCQGFSLAGRRKSDDPRNRLFKHYVAFVKLLKPPFLLLENVKGVSVAFRKPRNGIHGGKTPKPFSDRIKQSIESAGYKVFIRHVRAMELGVPQVRPRYIMLAIRSDLLPPGNAFDPFHDFEERRNRFLRSKNLPTNRPVAVREAISDLEIGSKKLVDCVDSAGYQQIKYSQPRTNFQRLLHDDLNGTAPNSMRLVKHRTETKKRFRKIIASCRHGVQLSDTDRKRFGLKKLATTPLAANRPSHTLTTLPDDFLHYAEPRILTVREYARLQSFPDWYAFRGKYSTGGDKRLRECPRYTQAANAVPPFLAEFLGQLLLDLKQLLCKDAF